MLFPNWASFFAMKSQKSLLLLLLVLFVTFMSIPFLVPHTGVLALFGLVPLLCMERIATMTGTKRIWLWHYSAFLLWNLVTTFWVCNATVGGGIFAALANALQMSIVFGLFRWSRKFFKGALPYIFLALLWIAWEKYYLTVAQISWPWLVLGNSFARTVSLVQWYEYFGTLGGSLWIWACNLGLFGIMVSLSDGSWERFNVKAKLTALCSCILVFIAPAVWSLSLYQKNEKEQDKSLDVIALQPNIDPYHKFQALSQSQQNVILLNLLDKALQDRDSSDNSMLLAVAPETFTSDVVTDDFDRSLTFRRFRRYLAGYPGVNMLFGASSYSYYYTDSAPSANARHLDDGLWVETHNSAIMMDGQDNAEIYHKSKLVVGVEMTPYPAFFTKIDDLLGGVMGRNVGQEQVSLLHCKGVAERNVCSNDGRALGVSANADGNVSGKVNLEATEDENVGADSNVDGKVNGKVAGKVNESIPVGAVICYESVYPEHCAEYVRKGAELLAIITNDAWWGDTPGYKQHLSYASLRAIETRRDIVRSANTGISAIIDKYGNVVESTDWWEPAYLKGKVNLNDEVTFFVRQGDIVGRFAVFLSVLLLLSVAVRALVREK